MEDLAKTLPKILNEFGNSAEVREAVVFAIWKKVAGSSLCEHAIPIHLKDKRLSIAVKDNTWKKHLEALAGQMIFKINSMLGAASVTFIEFHIDEDLVSEKTGRKLVMNMAEAERKELAMEEISSKLRSSAETIQDKDLREKFLSAAGSCLVRKKKFAK